jgi:hypothetical protein
VDARDGEGTRAMNSIFQVDVGLPSAPAGSYLGQGAHVRFLYQREPIGIGWYRAFRRLLLANLGV